MHRLPGLPLSSVLERVEPAYLGFARCAGKEPYLGGIFLPNRLLALVKCPAIASHFPHGDVCPDLKQNWLGELDYVCAFARGVLLARSVGVASLLHRILSCHARNESAAGGRPRETHLAFLVRLGRSTRLARRLLSRRRYGAYLEVLLAGQSSFMGRAFLSTRNRFSKRDVTSGPSFLSEHWRLLLGILPLASMLLARFAQIRGR
jgi:hypothetical protein